ncbi:hypothetical protein BSKO_01969 [Bryopsis sp. KO-2023]|nr:hypothetical protein BSKO_01969 [Bryopsis sp. KO-2023]
MNCVSACVRKWLLCCFPHEEESESCIADAESRQGQDKKEVAMGAISLTASTGLLSHGPGFLSPPQTVSLTATDTPSPLGSSDSSSEGSDVSQGARAMMDPEADRLANVVDVTHLIADLMLDGTRPAMGGQPYHEGNLETSLHLLQGCSRASIPQPEDFDYRRNLTDRQGGSFDSSPSPANEWWYRSEENFSFFSGQF